MNERVFYSLRQSSWAWECQHSFPTRLRGLDLFDHHYDLDGHCHVVVIHLYHPYHPGEVVVVDKSIGIKTKVRPVLPVLSLT